MNKYVLLLLIGSALFSCEPKVKDAYTIHATIDSTANGKLIKLISLQERKPITKDSMIVTNGEINFTGQIESPELFYLTLDGARGNIPFILENDDYDMTLHADSLHTSKVEGGKENALFVEYQQWVFNLSKVNKKFGETYRAARMRNDSVVMEDMRKKYDSLVEVNKQHDLDFITNNNGSVASALLLEQLYATKAIEDGEASKLYEGLTEYVKTTRVGKDIKEKLDTNRLTAVGSPAPEFSAPDPDGNMVSLSSIRGKATIIDFWAAWCGPCRKENPNVVKVYNKYHDKGLEIIGISLDGVPNQQNAKESWVKAIEDDSLAWHHVSNLKYFEDPVAKQYNITAIPATFILDAEGKIVAKNLRGEELEAKISELLD